MIACLSWLVKKSDISSIDWKLGAWKKKVWIICPGSATKEKYENLFDCEFFHSSTQILSEGFRHLHPF